MVWQWTSPSAYDQVYQFPGKTPGEKYKNLNEMVRKIADVPENQQKDSSTIEINPSLEIPEELIPLVQFEVAKILKHPKKMTKIIYKTDEILKALECSWYLNDIVESCAIFEYLRKIWSDMYHMSRHKVIHTLAKNQSPQNPKIAEKLYEMLLEKSHNFYDGRRQVEPLLVACSETFVRKKLENYRNLSSWTAKRLSARYPKIIVNYLTLEYKNCRYPTCYKYCTGELTEKLKKYLPHASKHFPQDFIKILLVHETNFNLKLNYKSSLYFLQQPECLQALTDHPEILFPILHRKIILNKLPKDQLTSILLSFFPRDPEDLSYSTENVVRHLEYLPEDDRVLLFLSLFEKRYGINYFEYNGDILSYEIIQRLPEKMRLDIARKKVDSGQKFDFTDIRCSWACYLPIDESFPLIKNEFNSAPDSMIESLIYTCYINKDKNALFEALTYITAKHENLKDLNLSNFFWLLNDLFPSFNDLTLDHWIYILDLFTKLNSKNQLMTLNEIVRGELVLKTIFLNLLRDLPADEDVNLFVNISAKHPFYSWSILPDQPLHLQEKCLDLIIKSAIHVKNQNEGWLKLISNILKNIYDLNKRQRDLKTPEHEELPLMSPKNYSWLCDEVVNIFRHQNARYHRKYSRIIKTILKENDPELLATWLGDEQIIADLYWKETLKLLKEDYEKVVENWEIYYEKCRKYINFYSTISFIKSFRWYGDISRKFEEKAQESSCKNEKLRILRALGKQKYKLYYEQIDSLY